MERGGEERRKKSLETRCHWFGVDQRGHQRISTTSFRIHCSLDQSHFLGKCEVIIVFLVGIGQPQPLCPFVFSEFIVSRRAGFRG